MPKRNPRITDSVCYYPQGRGKARSAVVQGYNGTIVDLTIWGKNVVVPECMSGIRHKDDPWNKERPERLRDNGCWDWPENEEANRQGERDQRDAQRAANAKAEAKRRKTDEETAKKEPAGSRAFPGKKTPEPASA